MSILIKNRSIFKIIIYLGIVLLTTSCKEVDPREDTDVYTYMALTPKLISELGGVDSLYRYQFYLSNSFRLSRVDNEKSYAGQGMVNNIDNNYNVVFDKLTPGIFHGTDLIEGKYSSESPTRTINILFEQAFYAFLTFACPENPAYSDNRFYHVKGELSDDKANSLEKVFVSDNYYNLTKFDASYRRDLVKEKDTKLYYLPGVSNKYYTYKNNLWNKTMIMNQKEKKEIDSNYSSYYGSEIDETYLIIRIKNVSKSSTEHAKGVVLPESL